MDLSTRQKGICSIIGGIIYQIGIGSIFPLGNFNIYIISYINNFNKDSPYQLYYGYFITPLLTFMLSFFAFLGGLIDNQFGCHWTLGIGSLIIIIATSLLYFITNIWGYYLTLALFGTGLGLGYLPSIKNACYFLPEHKGIISAIIISIGGIGAPFYNFFGESLINPQSLKLTDNELYYNFPISKNILKYYHIIIISTLIGSIISLFCIYQYKENIEIVFEENDKNTGPISASSKSSNCLKVMQGLSHQYLTDMKKILSSKEIWIFCLLSFFSTFLPCIIFLTFKVIGTIKHFQVLTLKIIIVGIGLIMCSTGPIWGLLFDKFGFRPLIIILNCCCIAIGPLMCLGLQNELAFAGLILFTSLIATGIHATIGPFIMKIFSIKYCMEICGIVGVISGSSYVLGSVFAFIATYVLRNPTLAFYSTFALGSVFSLIGVIFGIIITEIPIDFDLVSLEKCENKEISQTEIEDEKYPLLQNE